MKATAGTRSERAQTPPWRAPHPAWAAGCGVGACPPAPHAPPAPPAPPEPPSLGPPAGAAAEEQVETASFRKWAPRATSSGMWVQAVLTKSSCLAAHGTPRTTLTCLHKRRSSREAHRKHLVQQRHALLALLAQFLLQQRVLREAGAASMVAACISATTCATCAALSDAPPEVAPEALHPTPPQPAAINGGHSAA